jgi:predicted hydrolase (HD superfamily)
METLGINYQQAQELVEKYVSEQVTKLHLRETEVFMRALAKRFYKEEESAAAEAMADKWGIIGLLHDIDWDLTKNDNSQHCIKCAEILREAGGSDFLIETIQSHGYGMKEIPEFENKQRGTNLQHCLVASETLTGLIYASALMQPDKKLASVELRSLKKKFKNKGFAAKCNRETILECEKAGIPLDEFLQIGLSSMRGISQELGL